MNEVVDNCNNAAEAGEEGNTAVVSDNVLIPGELIKPQLSVAEVPALLLRLYGLMADTITPLNAYDDLNFLIKVSASSPVSNPHLLLQQQSGAFVLKILNSLDSRHPALVAGQNNMMAHLRMRGYNCPQALPNLHDNTFSLEHLTTASIAPVSTTAASATPASNNSVLPTVASSTYDDNHNDKEHVNPAVTVSALITPDDNHNHDVLGCGEGGAAAERHIVRLLSFLPGRILASVPLTLPLSRQVGRYVATMQDDLKSYSDAAVAQRRFIFMMVCVPQLRDFAAKAVDDPVRRALVDRVITAWQRNVEPIMGRLPSGYVHGDFNEQNILVAPTPDSDSENCPDPVYRISGVIDFGDVHVSCYVFELATTLAYMLLLRDSIEVAGHVIAGYEHVRQLSQDEWHVLWECVCGRLVTSVVMAGYSYLSDPTNDYLLTTVVPGWRLLTDLCNNGKSAALQQWREAAAAAAAAAREED